MTSKETNLRTGSTKERLSRVLLLLPPFFRQEQQNIDTKMAKEKREAPGEERETDSRSLRKRKKAISAAFRREPPQTLHT